MNTTNTLENLYHVEITTDHSGKMEGMQSLSTSCLCNEYCRIRAQNPDSICSKCYAERQMKRQKNTRNKMERNGEVLTTHRLTGQEIPTINARYFRFEAFGDIANTLHLENYCRIALSNPLTTFALWTKNIWLLDELFNKQGYPKPDNLIVIASSPRLNHKIVLADKYDGIVDKIFTVYDKIEAGKQFINCGGRNCIECQRCYHKDNGETEINEILK